ncbi:hypothetical protein I4U23_003153 [Adineta vaga]|nr:hypothetical protein I4U23_003153 [Adineta vaga]
MEKALPMFVLGGSCILVTALVFGILCGNMIRARRKIERLQRENEENQQHFPVYLIHSHSQDLLKLPITTINNTNQSAATHSSTTNMNEHQSYRAIIYDPTFKIHPYHKFSDKRIIEL